MNRRESLRIMAAAGVLMAAGTSCGVKSTSAGGGPAAPTTPTPKATGSGPRPEGTARSAVPTESRTPAGPAASSHSAATGRSPAPSASGPASVRRLTTGPTQPATSCYDNTFDGLSAYAKPGSLVLAGRENYARREFKNISAAGGTVLIYLDCVIANPYGRYASLLFNASEFGPAVPHWPGLPKASQWGYLADFRVGGVLQAKLPGVLEKMVAENPHMGGFFADDLGSRSYFPGFPWESLPTATQQAYRDGAIAACKTFRRVADRHGLMVMVNGAWASGDLASRGGGYPDMSRHGNALADGGCLEHHEPDAFHLDYATSTQWAAQSPLTKGKAFMYAVATTDEIREAWIKTRSVAYCATQVDYGRVPAPWAPFHATGLPSRVTTR